MRLLSERTDGDPVTLGPFLVALVIGLVLSAGLYFVLVWPRLEPEDPEEAQQPANDPEQSAQSAGQAR